MKKIKGFRLILTAIMLFCFVLPALACNKATVEPDEIRLNLSSLSLSIGETAQLSLIGENKETAVWESMNENVATVSASGLVTGVSKGSTNVRVTVLDTQLSCSISVSETPIGIPTLTIDKMSSAVYTGSSLTLTPIVRVGHAIIDLADIPVTWESSNTANATVDGGVVTGVAKGSTVITASCVYQGETLLAACDIEVILFSLYRFEQTEIDVFTKGDTFLEAFEPSDAEKSFIVTIKKIDPVSDEEITYEGSVEWTSVDSNIATASGRTITAGAVSGSTVIEAEIDGDILSLQINNWVKITQISELDKLSIATYHYKDNEAALKKILAGNYMLANDLDYSGNQRGDTPHRTDKMFLPIANMFTQGTGGFAGVTTGTTSYAADVRYSYESESWKHLLKLNNFSEFKGSNPLQLPFTGVFEGNGFAIKNALIMYDNYFYQNTLASGAFRGLGGQIFGRNEGIIRNVSFDGLNLENNLDFKATYQIGGEPKTLKTLIGTSVAVLPLADDDNVSFHDASGIIHQNSGLVENIFVSPVNIHVNKRRESVGLVVRYNDFNGIASNIVVDYDTSKSNENGLPSNLTTNPNYFHYSYGGGFLWGTNESDANFKNSIVFCKDETTVADGPKRARFKNIRIFAGSGIGNNTGNFSFSPLKGTATGTNCFIFSRKNLNATSQTDSTNITLKESNPAGLVASFNRDIWSVDTTTAREETFKLINGCYYSFT